VTVFREKSDVFELFEDGAIGTGTFLLALALNILQITIKN
jgi:hypothetical protein